METLFETSSALKAAWHELKVSQPQLRIRDAAKKLGVSEAELLATGIGGQVVRLNSDFANQVLDFPKLGKVMALTRNEGCVLEHMGTFQKIDLMGTSPNQIATIIGPIEQRIFFSAWKFGFAVSNETAAGPQSSLQYFDKEGNAVFGSEPRDLFTETNFRKFERSWDDGRVATAFFRGRMTAK